MAKFEESLLKFNEIYMSGVDITLFVKLYTEYLENCTKYLLTFVPDLTTLSNVSINWLDQNRSQVDLLRVLLDSISSIRTTYNAEDLRIIVESWLIKVCR